MSEVSGAGFSERLEQLRRAAWSMARPAVWLILAAMSGLVLATVLASSMRPLLEWTAALMSSVSEMIAEAWTWFARTIGCDSQVYYIRKPDVDREKISAIDLGFGVLGGSMLLATVKDGLKELREVVGSWRTVRHEKIYAASVTFLVSFLGLGLSVYGLNGVTAEKAPTDGGAQVYPLFLQPSQSVGVLPIFLPDARLEERYWGEQYNKEQGDQFPDHNIWTAGVDAREYADDVSRFVNQLIRCARQATVDGPVELDVAGYASSREFQRDGGLVHQRTDELNVRAANDRARSVFDVLEDVIRTGNIDSVRVREPIKHATLKQMYDQRQFIDRIPGHELLKQEGLARRVDVIVTRAPGCVGVAQLAGL